MPMHARRRGIGTLPVLFVGVTVFVAALVFNEGKLGIFVTLPFPANMFCTDDPESAFLAVGTITFMLVVCDVCTSFHIVSRRIQGPHLL